MTSKYLKNLLQQYKHSIPSVALTPVVSVVPVLWSRVGNTEEVIDTAAEAEAEMEEEKKLDSISVKVVGQVKKRRDEGLFFAKLFSLSLLCAI